MGAAAALEAIMCLLAGQQGVVPHTVGLEDLDPECDLDCVRQAPRITRTRISLSTSLGFGGSNAALIMESSA
jgi:3-oxoacyl-[acyl-carrier-protein] synthase II